MSRQIDAGLVTAYGYAVEGGYTGTEEEFYEFLANGPSLIENCAVVDGYYEGMTVGNAEQLVSSVFVNDEEPYLFRTAGGSADIGDRAYIDEIVGGSLVWNQLIKNGNFVDASNWERTSSSHMSYVFQDNVVTCTGTDGQGYMLLSQPVDSFSVDHVYLFRCSCMANEDTTDLNFSMDNTSIANYRFGSISSLPAGQWIDLLTVFSYSTSPSTPGLRIAFSSNNRLPVGKSVSLKDVMLIDLTLMFGESIANYVLSLKSAALSNAVAWVKRYIDLDTYHEYDAGTIKSVEGLVSHDTVGFNVFDLASEKAKVISGYVYEIVGTYTSLTLNGDTITPVNGKFTPESTGELIVAGGNSTTCIHLVWDGERDGEYEEYVKRSYPLDNLVTLRGIPKLDSANKLYYDGDIYEPDGTVTRNIGEITLNGSDEGTWGYNPTNNYFWIEILSSKLNYIFSKGSLPSGFVIGFTNVYPYGGYGISGDAVAANMQETKMYFYYRANTVTNKRYLFVRDPSFETVESFISNLQAHPQKLVFFLNDSTTEEATPYQSPQIVDDFGTEEFVTTGLVPVGHVTRYPTNLKAKLEMAPNSPDGDGDYIVRQTNGQNEYIPFVNPGELPDAPTEEGTYRLKCTVRQGADPIYSWEVYVS